MPKVSKDGASPIDQGGAGTEWRGELDGYTTSFVEVRVDSDLTELLRGLPGDVCPSSHWGYVFKGRTSFDGGKTFPRQGVTVAPYDSEDPAGTLPGSELGILSFPSFSLAPDGTLYVVFPRRTSDHSVVMLAKSTDAGLTWSASTT